MSPREDPGWRPPVALLALCVVYPVPFLVVRFSVPTIVALRALYMAAPIQWALIGVVLSSLGSTGNAVGPLAVVPAAGIVDLLLSLLTSRSIKPSEDPPGLALSFFSATMVAFALGNAAMLVGFVLFFQAGGMRSYLIGLPFAASILRIHAPTARRIARLDERLSTAGARTSLADAVLLPVRELPFGRKRPR